MIEDAFDVAFVARLARREKQVQQAYRPIIAVHKWFARRPGALFRSLLLSELANPPLSRAYFDAHHLRSKTICDPFMGGGTPLFEANRAGATVIGFDVSPLAWWIVHEELDPIDVAAYLDEAARLRASLAEEIGGLYQTACLTCGEEAPVKYFLWVKVLPCPSCGREVELLRDFVVATDERHTANVVLCSGCGAIQETADLAAPLSCSSCGRNLACTRRPRRAECPGCGGEVPFPAGPPRHHLFAIEYHCARCKPGRKGRFFKAPDVSDRRRVADASARWAECKPAFVPDDPIPSGDETRRLHAWGYSRFRELFNERQLLGLEASARVIAAAGDPRVRRALATGFSDLLRYQNMLVRYDWTKLKALDVFSIHGFPVSLIQAECNLLGIPGASDTNVGSGGWSNVVSKYAKAKRYASAPFETGPDGAIIPIPGETIAAREDAPADLRCESSLQASLQPESLDAVFTDPPYFANVQYAELAELHLVWLRRLARAIGEPLPREEAHHDDELTGNTTRARGLSRFAEGLSRVFAAMSRALKPGAPLAFTYHRPDLETYQPVAVAILDAGLVCTACPPCPAEMEGSVHIHGTTSSTLDTVFVCRRDASYSPAAATSREQLASAVAAHAAELERAGLRLSPADLRSITHGHLVRAAVSELRASWVADRPASERLGEVARVLAQLPAPAEVVALVTSLANERIARATTSG